MSRVGQNHIYIRCIYGIFGREITKYTVIYGVYIRFWPTLHVSHLSCLLILSALISTHTYIPASRLTLVCIQGAIEGHILGTFEDRAHLGFLSAFSGTFSITSYVHTGHTSYVHTGHTSYVHTRHTSYVHTGHTSYVHMGHTSSGHTSYVHTGHTSYAHTGHTSYVHTGHTNLLSLVCHAHCCSPKAFHGIQTCYPLFATHNAAVRRHLTALPHGIQTCYP